MFKKSMLGNIFQTLKQIFCIFLDNSLHITGIIYQRILRIYCSMIHSKGAKLGTIYYLYIEMTNLICRNFRNICYRYEENIYTKSQAKIKRMNTMSYRKNEKNSLRRKILASEFWSQWYVAVKRMSVCYVKTTQWLFPIVLSTRIYCMCFIL